MNMKDTKHALEITDDNFDEVVRNSQIPVVVDFWAEWCGPCRMLGPTIDELANDYEETVVVGKINVDNNSQVTSEFGIRSIPTVLIFKDGVVVDKVVGAVPKATLQSKLDDLLAKDATEE